MKLYCTHNLASLVKLILSIAYNVYLSPSGFENFKSFHSCSIIKNIFHNSIVVGLFKIIVIVLLSYMSIIGRSIYKEAMLLRNSILFTNFHQRIQLNHWYVHCYYRKEKLNGIFRFQLKTTCVRKDKKANRKKENEPIHGMNITNIIGFWYVFSWTFSSYSIIKRIFLFLETIFILFLLLFHPLLLLHFDMFFFNVLFFSSTIMFYSKQEKHRFFLSYSTSCKNKHISCFLLFSKNKYGCG